VIFTNEPSFPSASAVEQNGHTTDVRGWHLVAPQALGQVSNGTACPLSRGSRQGPRRRRARQRTQRVQLTYSIDVQVAIAPREIQALVTSPCYLATPNLVPDAITVR
jgi:hypothetical protein